MTRANVVIMPDGSFRILIDEGDFEGGKTKIQKIINGLQQAGTTFTQIGEVERHRHDDGGEAQKHVAHN